MKNEIIARDLLTDHQKEDEIVTELDEIVTEPDEITSLLHPKPKYFTLNFAFSYH